MAPPRRSKISLTSCPSPNRLPDLSARALEVLVGGTAAAAQRIRGDLDDAVDGDGELLVALPDFRDAIARAMDEL